MIVRGMFSRSSAELCYRAKQFRDEYSDFPTVYPKLFGPWWLVGYKVPWWERLLSWRR